MGFLDLFRRKPPYQAMQDDMRRLAPTLFPGGREQIGAAGRGIAELLGNRISAQSAARLYASSRYIASTAHDRSPRFVIEYIVRKAMGLCTLDEAARIYEHYIASDAPHRAPTPTPARRRADDVRSRAEPPFLPDGPDAPAYRLDNGRRVVLMDPVIFTTLMVGVRSTGYAGAAALFDGMARRPLAGRYDVSAGDARQLARRLSRLVARANLDAAADAHVRPLIEIAAEGAFCVVA